MIQYAMQHGEIEYFTCAAAVREGDRCGAEGGRAGARDVDTRRLAMS
jgi:hypothetical protein